MASSAGYPGRRDGRNAGVAGARWCLFIRLRARQLSSGARRSPARSIILGYAALSPKQIEKGIARLSDTIDDAIDDPATDMAAFFSDQSGRDFQRRAIAAAAGSTIIGSNRFYAAGRLLVHLQPEMSRDKVPRQCRF